MSPGHCLHPSCLAPPSFLGSEVDLVHTKGHLSVFYKSPKHLGWWYTGIWARCSSIPCLWGHIGLGDRTSVGISHRVQVVNIAHRCVVGTSHIGGVLDTIYKGVMVGTSHQGFLWSVSSRGGGGGLPHQKVCGTVPQMSPGNELFSLVLGFGWWGLRSSLWVHWLYSEAVFSRHWAERYAPAGQLAQQLQHWPMSFLGQMCFCVVPQLLFNQILWTLLVWGFVGSRAVGTMRRVLFVAVFIYVVSRRAYWTHIFIRAACPRAMAELLALKPPARVWYISINWETLKPQKQMCGQVFWLEGQEEGSS